MMLFRDAGPAAARCIGAGIALFLVGPSASTAQTTGPSATASAPAPGVVGDTALRLESVYRQLRERNPRVRAAEALAVAARARVPGAGLPPDPQLQLGWMNYELPSLEPMDALGMKQLQLMQMLPLGGKLGLAKSVARSLADAELARARSAWWDVRAQAAMAFYELYRTDQSLLVMRETLRLLDDTRQVTQAMYRVGNGNQVDVIRAQVEIARMTEDTIRMRTMRTSMAARLNALLDLAADTVAPSPELPAFPQSLPTLDSLEALASRARPMLRAGEAEVAASESMRRLTRRELFPDLQIGLQYGRQRRTGMPDEGPAPGGAQQMGSLMIGASIPIFARSRQLLARQETEAMLQMAQADLRAMQSDTRGSVAEQYAELLRARRLAALYRTTIIPQARAAGSSALAAYRVGKVDFMTLLDNQMIVNEYRQELSKLEAQEGQAWAELEMLTGTVLLPLIGNQAAPNSGIER
jgi:cobalt-zinc-cadmium efflux system outer membrane protein